MAISSITFALWLCFLILVSRSAPLEHGHATGNTKIAVRRWIPTNPTLKTNASLGDFSDRPPRDPFTFQIDPEYSITFFNFRAPWGGFRAMRSATLRETMIMDAIVQSLPLCPHLSLRKFAWRKETELPGFLAYKIYHHRAHPY